MTKIKVLVALITADGTQNPGKVLTVDDAVAENWIEEGVAEAIPEVPESK